MGGELRIAHLIGQLDPGGAERQVVNLLNEMAGLRPLLVLTAAGRPGQLSAELSAEVELLHSPVRLRRLPADVLRLAWLLRSRGITIVHAHMFWASFFGALACALAGIPVLVTTEHGMNPWKRDWHSWLERNVTSRRAARRLCVSSAILEQRRTQDRLPATQLQLMPNGTRIGPPRRPSVAQPIRLLAVGRLVEAKDYPNLLRAARALQERGCDFRLQIAGDGPQRAALEALAVELGLGERVRFLGTRTDIATLMRQSDIFVLASAREGQPLVLLEAMAAALPIVATRVGGIPQTAAHGEEAVLVNPQDFEALAAAIERLLRDPARAAGLGLAARRRALAQYSIDRIAQEHLALYRNLLAQRHA